MKEERARASASEGKQSKKLKERVSMCTWWRMSNDSRVCGCSNNKISIEDMGVLKSCIICKEYQKEKTVVI